MTTRTFDVSGTWEDFVSQANHYGKAKQGERFVKYMSSDDAGPILVHRVTTAAAFSQIDFTHSVTPAAVLMVTAVYSAEAEVLSYLDGLIRELRRKQQGARAGTVERVRAFHQLLKSGRYTHRQARIKVKETFGTGIDMRTYEDNCVRVTGDQPIYPPQK